MAKIGIHMLLQMELFYDVYWPIMEIYTPGAIWTLAIGQEMLLGH